MAVEWLKVDAVGNLTKDAELKVTPKGTKVLEFNLATNKGKGETKKTTYIRVSQFGQRGEGIAPYLLKGVQVLVRGNLSLDEWTDKEGNKRSSLTISADDVQILKYAEGVAVADAAVAEDVNFDDVPF